MALLGEVVGGWQVYRQYTGTSQVADRLPERVFCLSTTCVLPEYSEKQSVDHSFEITANRTSQHFDASVAIPWRTRK